MLKRVVQLNIIVQIMILSEFFDEQTVTLAIYNNNNSNNFFKINILLTPSFWTVVYNIILCITTKWEKIWTFILM